MDTFLCIKQITNKDIPLYSTGNHAQYFVITSNRKKSDRDIDGDTELNRSAEHRKQIQHAVNQLHFSELIHWVKLSPEESVRTWGSFWSGRQGGGLQREALRAVSQDGAHLLLQLTQMRHQLIQLCGCWGFRSWWRFLWLLNLTVRRKEKNQTNTPKLK